MPDPLACSPQELLINTLDARFYHFAFDEGQTVDWMRDDRAEIVQLAREHLSLIDANDAFARANGFADRQAILRQGFKFAQLFQDAATLESVLAEILSIGAQPRDSVMQQLDHEGRMHFMRSVTALDRRDGRVAGFYGVQWDVTQDYATRAALEAQNKQLSTLQAIGQLAESNLPVNEFLTRTVELLPLAMQYPELALAAIEFDGRVYGSREATTNTTRIAYGILLNRQEAGRVHIAYRERRLFVASESAFIRSVAERIAGYIERIRALVQLERLTMAVEQAIDGIAVADLDGYIQFVNAAWAQMHGYTPDELIGKHLSTFHSLEQLKEEVEPFNKKVLEQGNNQGEVGHVRRDGTPFPTWMAVALLRQGGKPIGLVATARDISERRAAELERERLLAEAQESERLLRSIIDATPDWIFIKDQQHRYVLVNQGYANSLHLKPDDFVGKNDLDLGFPEALVRGDPERGIAGFWADDRAVMDGGLPKIIPRDIVMVDGKQRIYNTLKTPLRDAEGRVWGVLAFCRDVTEREQLLADLDLRSGQLQAAAQVSRAAINILNSEDLIRRSVELIRDRFDYYYVGLFMVDETGEWSGEVGRWAVLRAGTGEAGREMVARGHKLEIGGNSMIGQCLALGRARIALDVGVEAYHFDNPLLPHTRSEMALPLIARGRTIGALTIQSTREAAFSETDITVLQIMADQLAMALQTAMLLEQAQLQAERERLVRTIAERIYRATDREEILRVALEELGRLLGASRTIVQLGRGQRPIDQ